MRSVEMTVKDAEKEIRDMRTANEIRNFIEGDDRSGVQKDADKKIQKIAANRRNLRSVSVSALGQIFRGVLTISKDGLYQLIIQKFDNKPLKVKKTKTHKRKKQVLKIGVSPVDYAGKAYTKKQLEENGRLIAGFLEENELNVEDATALVASKNVKGKDEDGNPLKEVPLIDEQLKIKTALFMEDDFVIEKIPYYTEGMDMKIEDYAVIDVYHNMKNRAIRQTVMSYIKLNSK